MKKDAMLYEKLQNQKVQCKLCAHNCIIKESEFGFCGVRQNIKGKLYTHVYGELIANNTDSIEKKPLYHFLPGTRSYSIATPGCNFKCSFCQNWRISQMDKKQERKIIGEKKYSPKKLVENTIENNCKSIAYTYTEPTIFFEYAYDTAKIAKKHNLYNVFVTNGYMTKEALEKINPYLDAANIDLKSFDEEFYKKICKSRLKPVLNTIQEMKKLGIWIEITTLVVPDQNDSDKELNQIAEFISKTGKEIPWHISRFHPDYQYNSSGPTPIETLEKAKKIGEKHGLKYVYIGNVSSDTDTVCPNCKNKIIKRSPFSLREINLENGKCPKCQTKIEGIWN
ncbi:MAG: AmmeMemoRadiSam system radical SAM enzyme [Candidatus Thermoplasmatota archaeon]